MYNKYNKRKEVLLMIERFFNYSLTALVLLMAGIFYSAFTFGEYTMLDALWDTYGIMIAIAATDWLYHFLKLVLNRDDEEV